MGASMTASLVRRATLEEIFPPEPYPTTLSQGERLTEASRQVYEILRDLAGCISQDRNGVNELRGKVRRLNATILGIEFEPDCEYR